MANLAHDEGVSTNLRHALPGSHKKVDKKQDGKQHDHQGKSYNLPIVDVGHEMRNFEGVMEHHCVTKEDFFKEGDGPGTTDTDAKNDPKHSSNKAGYTKIYGGKGYRTPFN